MEHTPGPWSFNRGTYNTDDMEGSIGTVSGDGWNLAHIWGDFEDNDKTVVAEANARLIAAAPDLLEACKIAVEYADHIMPGSMRRIEDAIAKATGND